MSALPAWKSVAGFLRYGARARPDETRLPFYRHKLFVRISHALNAWILLVMLMSGLQIFNAHPALYWGQSADFDHPIFSLSAERSPDGTIHGITQAGHLRFDTTGWLGYSSAEGQDYVRGFPAWATLPGPQWLALGRQWHFFFAWLLVINAAFFLVFAFVTRHVQRDLAPKLSDLKGLPREIIHHAQLRFPRGDAARRYNALQRLTYFGVIFVLGPLIVLTGLTMSPTMDSAFPILPWIFGGRQSARSIHFLCAFSFVAFFLVHMIMVVLSGTWNNVRSMITGWYAVETDGEPHA